MKCEYCMSEMNENATVCHSCQKTRKDIAQLRNKSMAVYSLGLLILVFGLLSGGWSIGFFDTFSFKAFLTSFTGWGVILLVLMGTRYEFKYRKAAKLKITDDLL